MTEYIDRETVLNILASKNAPWDGYQKVSELPAVDVQSVKHGRWIPVTNGRGGNECNQCHAYAPSYQNGSEYKSKYCPNCGAKMDGAE